MDDSVGTDYSVGQVAALAKVTVRTLHHYDGIGLLRPGGRTRGGYRRYTDADLERLAQIRFYRELDFPLDEIAAILAEPGTDASVHLRRQRELLTARYARLSDLIAAIDKALEATQMGIPLTPQERFEVFGRDDPAQYEQEAKQRWGDTDSYRESARRTAGYTKADWLELKAAQQEIEARFASLLTSGAPADSPEAMAAAQAHQDHITRWFYDCTVEIHRGLADMYLNDPRFTSHYESQAAGLAAYVHAAIHANADRAT